MVEKREIHPYLMHFDGRNRFEAKYRQVILIYVIIDT